LPPVVPANALTEEEIPMRKIVASLFVSLDGVIEAPERWHFPYHDEEMEAAIDAGIDSADSFLLGRRTYEEFAAFWPAQPAEGGDIAEVMNTRPKYVVSRTLDEVTWQNSTLLGPDFAGEVARLKEEPGKDISVIGSATLVRSLLREGLLDELRLTIHPLVVGRGKRLFEDGDGEVLELAGSETFRSGVLYLTYRPAEA
jgi:dihydrofolate reductase